MALRDLFGRGREPRNADAVARIKAWVGDVLMLPREATVTVSEIVCPDPGCADLETVILVLQRGRRTRAFKVSKAISAVTELDVGAALLSEREADLR